ncbi:MAG: ferritin-like domain-containing protein [Chloroflexota bacterium]
MQQALRVLWEGMINERDGYRFYIEAARRTRHQRGVEMYQGLARDEVDHLRLFLVEYLAVSEGRSWVEPREAMQSQLAFDVDAPDFGVGIQKPQGAAEVSEKLFPDEWSHEAIVGSLDDDLAALRFGMQIEERAYRLYEQAGKASSDPQAQEVYAFLVEEESRHYQLIQNAYHYLADNETWWDDLEAPFFEG